MSWTGSTPSDGSLEGLTLVRRELQRRQPPGVKPALRTGPVPRPVLSSQTKRPSHRRGPETPRPAVRCSSASSGGLGRSTRALRPLSGQRSPRRPGSPRPLRRPLRNRPDSRVPQHRGHHIELGRRNPELAPQPPFQRTPRRHQQPNPNPPQNRPRVHKPPKLRRPRTPPNMNPHHQPARPQSHEFAKGRKKNWPLMCAPTLVPTLGPPLLRRLPVMLNT